MRQVDRGEVYWIDQAAALRLVARGTGYTLPPFAGTDPPQARIDLSHPFLVVETRSRLTKPREAVVGIFLTSVEAVDLPRERRIPFRVVIEPNELIETVETARHRSAACEQIFTMDTDCFAIRRMGRVVPAAMRRITVQLVNMVGGRDP